MYMISFADALFCRSSNRFLLLDAMLARYNMLGLYVFMYVPLPTCVSVTSWISWVRAKHDITQTTSHNSPHAFICIETLAF